MCGIAGFVGPQGRPEQLRRMTEALRRRGPDDEGFYEAGNVGFGFRRLSIIDVAGGHQPLSNEDGDIWAMLNGEIYGYQRLRETLVAAGHRFKTQGDTETIVHAYEEWGDACFEKLNGMFAIALWDGKRRRLVVARDRLGKKPLYWTEHDGTLWFASELKALQAAGVITREIDPVSLALYFRTDAVPTPHGIFLGANKLEPASAMAWKDGRIEKTWTFWHPPHAPSERMSSENATIALRSMIDASVRERLVSDVPLGLFLSGGLDSALIAESAARQSSGPLKAFTIGFEHASLDERDQAARVAKTLGLDHYAEVLSQAQVAAMLDEATDCLDEPLADPAVLPQMLLARFARQQVTVAVTGDGGDELLLGYPTRRAHEVAERAQLFWRLSGALRGAANALPVGRDYFSFGFAMQRTARGFGIADPWARDLAWRGSFTADALSSLLLPDIRHVAQVRLADAELAGRAGEMGSARPFWQRWSWAYLRTFLMDDVLVKVDRATMWMGLEARSPLLDPRVVDAAFSIPDRWKTGAWGGKRLFKELLRGRVPQEVLDRPKHGFWVPTAELLSTTLAPELKAYADPSFLRQQGLFDAATVLRLTEEHRAGRPDRRKELWAYFMFQRWWARWAAPSHA